MQFDGTVTLGTILAAVAIVSGTWAALSRYYSLIDKRLAVFESMLKSHADTLITHDARMARYEVLMQDHANDLHKVMGRLEGKRDT